MTRDELKARFKEIVNKEVNIGYLTEDERDEKDRLILERRSDPDFNIDDWLNN